MKSNPLITVIVITYNSAAYVVETLESVNKQDYKNLELIISDDNSKDETIKIVGEWIEKNNSRFTSTKVISPERNTGIPANCNRGVKAATGDFIKIIAGDDILLSDCVSSNLKFIEEKEGRNIVISEMQAFLDDTEPKKYLELKKPFGNVFSDNHSARDQNKLLLNVSYFGNAPSLFYRKTVFDIVLFDESIPLLEDYPFAINATKAGFKYEYLPKVTVLYRVREDSAYFKKRKEIFGKFYRTKYQFDKKYRFPYLDFVALANEKVYYSIHKYFDDHNLNKNTIFLNLLFKTANLANPFRYVAFLRNKIKRN